MIGRARSGTGARASPWRRAQNSALGVELLRTKDPYLVPWDDTPDWERESAAAVYDQVRAFIDATDGGTTPTETSQRPVMS